jgi:hypothetical protein
MLKITTLTDSPYQTAVLKLESGISLQFTLRYFYNQQGWYYSFTYGSYTLNNRRMVNSGNMISQIQNIVPFGLACLLTDPYEPVFIDDFSSGRATLYTLNPSDVALFNSTLQTIKLTTIPT